MSLNFLDNSCKEPERLDLCFGLCDDEDGNKAYSDIEHPETWIATVKNDNATRLTFIPIDKCLIKDDEYSGQGRCDGILISTQHLYFVELKNMAKKWIPEAIEQLEATIKLFKSIHDINEFKHKKAFACNKQRRHFQEIDNELNLLFFRKHRLRIDIQSNIIVA